MCVCIYYTPNQLGGQRSPLFTTIEGFYVPSTQLNYSPTRRETGEARAKAGKKVNKRGGMRDSNQEMKIKRASEEVNDHLEGILREGGSRS